MSDRTSADLDEAAQRLLDEWFDPLWAKRQFEIEVRRKIRRPKRLGREQEEGLHLYAPFGLGGRQNQWWEPARRRATRRDIWHELRSVAEVEEAIRRRLSTALDVEG